MSVPDIRVATSPTNCFCKMAVAFRRCVRTMKTRATMATTSDIVVTNLGSAWLELDRVYPKSKIVLTTLMIMFKQQFEFVYIAERLVRRWLHYSTMFT